MEGNSNGRKSERRRAAIDPCIILSSAPCLRQAQSVADIQVGGGLERELRGVAMPIECRGFEWRDAHPPKVSAIGAPKDSVV